MTDVTRIADPLVFPEAAPAIKRRKTHHWKAIAKAAQAAVAEREREIETLAGEVESAVALANTAHRDLVNAGRAVRRYRRMAWGCAVCAALCATVLAWVVRS